ncbi:MAG: hypothetical protein EBR49_19845, partial [Betaproteobacteria bacterium]|nr:hypothetical protein [Betaproteobacteria bacterium]
SKRQTALSNLQENLTSGKRVVRPSDDPTAAAQAERSLMRLSRIATDQRALEVQRNTMANAESTLGDVVDALQQFRELVVSAGNGSHTAAERQTIANQLQGLREQILGYANRTDTNGQPLFGALASASVPFTGPTATAPDYTYNGLPGQTATSETAIASSLDGESAFMHQPARDGVYNVSMTTIPAGRSLSTGNVSVTDSSLDLPWPALPGRSVHCPGLPLHQARISTDCGSGRPTRHHRHARPLAHHYGHPRSGRCHYRGPQPQHLQRDGRCHPGYRWRDQRQCGEPSRGAGHLQPRYRHEPCLSHPGSGRRLAEPGGPHYLQPGKPEHSAGGRPFARRRPGHDQGRGGLP